MRLYEYDVTICNCGCGLPVAEAHSKDTIFIVESDVCYARRAIEKVRGEKREQAMRSNKGDGWDAGLKLYARSVTREQALEHMAKEQAKLESNEVGPRMAAAQAMQEQDQEQRTSTRLGAKAREKQQSGGRLGAR